MRRNYYEAFRHIDAKSENLGIEIRWAGRAYCQPDFNLSRYHKRYLLLYVTGGVCVLDDDGINREIEPGNVILFHPHKLQRYRSDTQKPLRYYGLSFSGKFIDSVMAGMPLTGARFHYIGENPALRMMFHDIIGEMLVRGEDRSEIIWGLFFRLIGELNTLILQTHRQKDENFVQEQSLRKAAEYICLNYNINLKLRDIASIAGYSVSRFEALFHKQYSLSPIHYHIKQRIDKAKELLRMDMLKISEVCHAIGFNDPLYFSKIFKKYVGVSPKCYRKTAKSTLDFETQKEEVL
jgi:AraC-like DNA-binding protein